MNLKLQRIEESAFAKSVLVAMIIPFSVEMLCKLCLSECKSPVTVTFELNSKLQRIEAFAFAWSHVTDLLPPSSLRFLSGAIIVCLFLNMNSFWPDPSNFKVYDFFIEDITGHSLVGYLDQSSAAVIQSRIEISCEFCFANCESLTAVIFKVNSKLQ
jgi:hypothetical protein